MPEGTETEWYSSGEGYVSNTEIINTLEYSKTETHVTYSYTCTGEGEYVEFPLFYYEGYEGIDQDGNKVRYNCIITDEPITIDIRFRVSPVYTFCFVIGLVNILLFIAYEFVLVKRNKDKIVAE